MIWIVKRADAIQIGAYAGPGFSVQQEGRPPSLTLVFRNNRDAEQSAAAMERILENSLAVSGR